MAVIDGYTSFLGLEDGLALRLALKVHKNHGLEGIS